MELMLDLFDNNHSGAEFSDCKKYRYKLWRIWNEELPFVMCIGLNPSTANADKNDPTIRILKKTLSGLGYGGFYMTNMYAIISSKPEILQTDGLNLLKDNEYHLADTAMKCCDNVIFCWGGFKQISVDRISYMERRFPKALCFGKTAEGRPIHPMALMYGGVENPTLVPYAK